MADRQFKVGGVIPAPADWVLPSTLQIIPKMAYASFDGSGAGASFLPCLRIISDSGQVAAECVVGTSVAAGASADVTWFPWWRGIAGKVAPPTPLGSLYAWYDFSDTSTTTLDGSGNIQSIKDKTGNGHDLQQATAAQRPAVGTLNGLACGVFNTTAYTWLMGGFWTPALAQPYTVLIVITNDVAQVGGNSWPGPFGNETATSTGVLIQLNPFGQWFLDVSASSFNDGSITSPFTQHMFGAIVDGASSHFYFDLGSDTGGSLDGTKSLNQIALGAAHVPERLPLVEGWDGRIGECMVYSGHLTNPQLSGAQNYLRTKWGTP